MLKTRLITALILLALFLPAIFFAPIRIFGVLIASALGIAAAEWARLLKFAARACIIYVFIFALTLGLTITLRLDASTLFQAAAAFWLFAAPFIFLQRPVLTAGIWRLFLLAAGMILFVAGWHALIKARRAGAPFALSILLLVCLADSGAYFAGKRFGRHKLAPSISPGKSWEGALGGWLLALMAAAAAIATRAFEPTLFTAYADRLGLLRALAAVTALVGAGMVGDLFESLLKRQAGVKDSGALLPGHGGVLDRIDALLPVLPLAMLLAER